MSPNRAGGSGRSLKAMWIAATIVGFACSDAGAVDAVIRGVAISLSDRAGKCRITSGDNPGTSVDLLIPWPCTIHRGADGAVRIQPDGSDGVFLVESSRPDPARPTDCITEIQAIRVRDRTLMPSDYRSVVAKCPPFQWDQVMFKGLFAKP